MTSIENVPIRQRLEKLQEQSCRNISPMKKNVIRVLPDEDSFEFDCSMLKLKANG